MRLSDSAKMRKADVWNYFVIVEYGDKKKTKCQLCRSELSYSGGTTSAMRNHLKMVHKKTQLDEKPTSQSRQSTLLMFNNKKKVISGSKHNEITRALALACALDLRPVSMVSGRGFMNFCSKINPEYHIPCRTTVHKHLDLIYTECKTELIEFMTDTCVSLTTDLWTSIGTRSYITLTAHFIKNWKLEAKLLATRPLDEKHTGANIATTVLKLKEEFKIRSIGALVTDNAANMLVAAREAGMIHISCYSHTIQLAIEDGLKMPTILKALAHARRLVGHFSHSVASVEALKTQQIMMGNNKPLLLIQDVQTRWNSQYLMITRLLKLRIPVFGVLMDTKVTKALDRAGLDLPDASWQVLEDLVPILEPLAEATELLTKENSPTISQVHILLVTLLQTLKACDDDRPTPRDLKIKITNGLRKRFHLEVDGIPEDDILTSAPVVATFLDPRYKSLKGFSDEKKEKIVQYVQDLTTGQLDEVPQGAQAAPVKVKMEPEETAAKSSLFDCLMGDVEIDLTESQNDSESEIKAYRTESVAEPLIWWKGNENR